MNDGKDDMRTLPFGLKITCCGAALLVLGSFAVPEPAHAQFGINIGGLIRAFGGGVRFKGGGGTKKHEKGDSSDDSSSDSARKSRDDRVLASLGAPSSKVQTGVLMSVQPGDVLGIVGSKQDLQQKVGQTASKDADRDWTGKIVAIALRFKNEQDKGEGRRMVGTAGDVTEHAIEESLDAAYKKAKLDTFESFIGENWTAERLRKAILDRVEADLPGLFVGNNRGNVTMQQLDTLIQRAADSTYRRIFELSELLASNKSSALFVQRLYQTHGGQVDDQVREIADGMIMKAAGAAIAKFEGPMRLDQNGVALHYRAERIVYDCLSENVEEISSSSSATDIATASEMEQRIEKTAKDDCESWLDNQFGTQTRSLTAQTPVPMRAMWSAARFKDDPSMYSQARGAN
jgi:hypothetical protein